MASAHAERAAWGMGNAEISRDPPCMQIEAKYRSLRNNKKVFSNYWAFSNRSRHFPTIQSRPYGSPYRSGNALLLFLVFS